MPQSTASNLGVSKRGNSPMICTQFLLLHTLNEIILLQEIPPHVNWQSLGRQSLHCSSLKSRAQNQYVYLTSVRIAGGVGGVDPPYLILPTPLPLVKIRPRGGRVSTPPPKFCEVGMLLDSHF